MQHAIPSRTAQRVAMRRATHQRFDDPRVFDDPLAVAITCGDSESLADASTHSRERYVRFSRSAAVTPKTSWRARWNAAFVNT